MAKLGLFKFSDDTKAVRAGETIFQKGDPGDFMYVIREGTVQVRIDDAIVRSIGPDEFFGEMALLNDAPRSATAVAVTDCELIPLDARRFTFLIQETPYFAIEVMRVMAARIQETNDRAKAG